MAFFILVVLHHLYRWSDFPCKAHNLALFICAAKKKKIKMAENRANFVFDREKLNERLRFVSEL